MHEDIRKKPGLLETLGQLYVAYRGSHPDLVIKAEGRTFLERFRNLRETRLRLSSLLALTCGRCSKFFIVQESRRCYENFKDFKYYALTEDCPFCDILRGCFEHFVGDDLLGHTLRECCITVSLDWSLELQVCFNITEEPWKYRDFGDVHLQLYSPEYESRHHPFKVIKGIGTRSDSAETVGKILNWISDCVANHGCSVKQRGRDFIPTRLIELYGGTHETIRLASSTTQVQYTALSYCWGNSKQSTTTKQNLESRRSNIAVSELPKTLRDAITMTRALGLDYLWIDAICIVQDDANDWATEASRMADVYSSAYLVLAATNTSDCDDGFLPPRPESVIIKAINTPPVHVRRAECHHTEKKPFQMERYPLFKRAWCMQERELACRTLHLLPDEVVWQCGALTDCECGANPEHRDAPTSESDAVKKYACLKSSAMHDTTVGKVWAAIVEDYCRLGITYVSDTLPALTGLAQHLDVLQPGRYIAGLWETDIAFLLNWSLHTEYGAILPRGGAKIDGPTFSWITVPGAVRWPDGMVHNSMCKLESVESELATQNPYGPLKSCSIRLRGRVLHSSAYSTLIDDAIANWVHRDSNFAMVKVLIDEQAFTNLKAYSYNITPSWKDARSSWEDVIFLELYHEVEHDEGFGNGAKALLLQKKVGEMGVYMRIGTVSYALKRWFEEYGVEEVVTVV